ncbi:hypothetical protein CPB84DRAFT_1759235 [Gymnopilus junonius]|uniref:DUF6534 domain-containing protein n=1 Tax=Gymnopilus junonius TaxID=109634 RepID=A0A9P5P421_GYMJU|nr:hypothetical protein CPB84DRAFT_1759235 [Gymnopilus junonius]
MASTPDVRLLFGPMLMGVFINMLLYGILVVQTYHYYQTFKRDAPWIKYLVFYLFIIESLNSAFDMAMMWQALIQGYGQPPKFFPTLFAAEPIVIVMVSTPIQMFFAWRIKLLTKSNILALIIVALSVVSLGGGTYTTALIIKIKLFARKPELHWPALVWFLSATVADVMITAVLVMTLSRRKTGFVATDDAISKIIRMTVQTGMVTAFFALGDVVFFMTLPHTALNFLWDLSLSKLYSNCLLSTLNARESLQDLTGYQSQQRHIVSSGGNRRPEERIDPPAHILSSSMYELDTHKVNRDMEYGVTITKIVETRQDPVSPTQ